VKFKIEFCWCKIPPPLELKKITSEIVKNSKSVIIPILQYIFNQAIENKPPIYETYEVILSIIHKGGAKIIKNLAQFHC